MEYFTNKGILGQGSKSSQTFNLMRQNKMSHP